MFVLPIARSSAFHSPLARRFDRAFEDQLGRLLNPAPAAEPVRSPALSVSESDQAYTVQLDLPGVAKQDVRVSVEGRRLTVRTQVPASTAAAPAAEADRDTATASATAPATERVLYDERSQTPYARTVQLPVEIDAAAVVARMDNGVLSLTLPKRVASGAAQITVR